MSRRIIKSCLILAGTAILVACITGEVDGIGRAAMVFSGVAFVFIGYFIKDNSK